MNGMRGRSRRAANRANEALAERESQLLKDTTIDWDRILPRLTDEAEQQALKDAVAHQPPTMNLLGSCYSAWSLSEARASPWPRRFGQCYWSSWVPLTLRLSLCLALRMA